MQELGQAIPDVDAMLALAPEELGAKLLFMDRRPHVTLVKHVRSIVYRADRRPDSTPIPSKGAS